MFWMTKSRSWDESFWLFPDWVQAGGKKNHPWRHTRTGVSCLSDHKRQKQFNNILLVLVFRLPSDKYSKSFFVLHRLQ